jgi:serine/threonine protein kinase
MEYVEGKSLRRLIREQGALDPAAASAIVTQVCAALDEAHRHHIIHRDIKPDNIIVRSTGAGLVVKVLDFGIAKLRDDVASHLTQTGSVLGTPHYMSPEQCLGEAVDGRADIYSLGIVLYEMLSGRVPFDAPISTAVVIQHVNEAPPSLSAINPNINRRIEAVVFHALAKRPEARPATADVFARELAAAIASPDLPLTVSSPASLLADPYRPAGFGTEETAVQSRVSRPAGQPSGQHPPPASSISNVGLGAPAQAQNLPWKIAAVVFGCLLFTTAVALITWKLTREDKPADVAPSGQTASSSPGARTSPAPPTVTPNPPAEQPLRYSVTASSTRPAEPGKTYYPTNIVDGNLNTAWDEHADGPGLGSWVQCNFDREVALDSIQIYPGYFKGAYIWSINNRLAAATFYFSDGSSRSATFPDLMQPQDLATGGVRTRWVKLVIDRIYPGKDDLDTPISELKFAWRP